MLFQFLTHYKNLNKQLMWKNTWSPQKGHTNNWVLQIATTKFVVKKRTKRQSG